MSIELPSRGIVLLYGSGGAGKTTLATHLIKDVAKRGERCLYAYSGKLSPLLVRELFEAVPPISLFKLRNYEEQHLLVRSLYRCKGAGHKLLVFDTFTELYRVFIAESSDPLRAGKMLNQQLAMLADLASKEALVFLTSRVRSLNDDLEPEASSLISYWADMVLRLDKLGKPGWRRLVVEKAKAPAASKLEGLVIEVSPWSRVA
ncbi:MAG: hypothetical protein QXT74_00105 [Candidatus Nezhaarchaeales archaeon]